jgi:cobalamin biosynthesis Mg chelatase CobN
MFGKRHPAPPRAQLVLGRLSVFVLLAFALLPAVALAQDSSSAEYEEAFPTPTGKKDEKTPANSSGSNGGSGQSSTGSGTSPQTESSEEDSSSDDKGGAAATNRDGGSGQGSPGKGAKGDDRSRLAVPPGESTGDAAADDSGSSPLVPILIALAVLAAISIGVVVMRRRSQGSHPGSSASPEAS